LGGWVTLIPTAPLQRWKRCESYRWALVWHTGRPKMALERGTNPKRSHRACACEYGLQPWIGKSAGVAKRPRERSPTRNPFHTLRFAHFPPSLYAAPDACGRRGAPQERHARGWPVRLALPRALPAGEVVVPHAHGADRHLAVRHRRRQVRILRLHRFVKMQSKG
jgi:hypothetical protein